MLILSRKAGESILINDSVCVKVLHTKRGSVRLGIEAPREVPVVRDELREDRGPSTYSGRAVYARQRAKTACR